VETLADTLVCHPAGGPWSLAVVRAGVQDPPPRPADEPVEGLGIDPRACWSPPIPDVTEPPTSGGADSADALWHMKWDVRRARQ
jgi:hypothetical protein